MYIYHATCNRLNNGSSKISMYQFPCEYVTSHSKNDFTGKIKFEILKWTITLNYLYGFNIITLSFQEKSKHNKSKGDRAIKAGSVLAHLEGKGRGHYWEVRNSGAIGRWKREETSPPLTLWRKYNTCLHLDWASDIQSCDRINPCSFELLCWLWLQQS